MATTMLAPRAPFGNNDFHAAPSAPPPTNAPTFRLLNTHQNALGGDNACAFAATYWAFYMLFSETPHMERMLHYLRQACTDWNALRPTAKQRATLDQPGRIIKEVQPLARYMRIRSDIQGILITEEVYQRLLPLLPSMTHNNADYFRAFSFGIQPLFAQLATDVMALPPCRALSFVFSAGNATMGGCFRKQRNGNLRIDLFDSHCRPFEQSKEGSASWVTCYSVPEAVTFLEMYHPPYRNFKKLQEYLTRDQHARLDQQEAVLPAALFSFTNIRGLDFDVGIVDEAAFVKPALLTEGMIPVANKDRACLIMPTTPGPRNSYFMNLVSLKSDDGKPRMPLIRVGQPCQACMKTAEPWLCKHNLKDDPKWKNRSKQEKNLYLYQGDVKTYMQEQFGVSTDETIRPMLPKHIVSLRTRPLYKDIVAPECMFLAADSAYGGKCEFAIIAGYFPSRNSMVITYADAFHLPGGNVEMERERLQAAVDVIRSKYGEVPIVFLPEAAPGNAGAHLSEHLLYHPKVLTMAEANNRGDGLGVPATDRNRQTSRMALMLATNSLHYSEQMSTYPGPDAKPVDELKNQLEKQLLGWEKVIKYDDTDPHARVQYKWTAKHAAGNDDLAVAALMLGYWPEVFYQNPHYTNWIANNIKPGGASLSEKRLPQAHLPEDSAAMAHPSKVARYSPAVMSSLLATNSAYLAPSSQGGAPPAVRKRVASIMAETHVLGAAAPQAKRSNNNANPRHTVVVAGSAPARPNGSGGVVRPVSNQ